MDLQTRSGNKPCLLRRTVIFHALLDRIRVLTYCMMDRKTFLPSSTCISKPVIDGKLGTSWLDWNPCHPAVATCFPERWEFLRR